MPSDTRTDTAVLTADEPAASSAMQKPVAKAPLFAPLNAQPGAGGASHDIDLILDIPVQVTVELGRTRIPIRNILQLAQGSVIELEAAAGAPMDVLVNGCLIAQGEVVVVNDRFGVRLTDVVSPAERIKRLR